MTADLTRPRPPAPTGFLPTVPTFTLTSADLTEQGRIPDVFTGVHDNVSPALSWSGFPEQTQSFVVSCFDPDAPTMSGWWHWTIVDLDASVTSLERGAGASDLQLDGAAFHLAGSRALRPSKTTRRRTSPASRAGSSRRYSSHSVASRTASAPATAS